MKWPIAAIEIGIEVEDHREGDGVVDGHQIFALIRHRSSNGRNLKVFSCPGRYFTTTLNNAGASAYCVV
jgi:hypothetical protein